MPQITVSGLTIDVVRKDIKNVHLAVYPPAGRVRIAAPFRVEDEAIRIYAISRLGWIRRQQTKFDAQVRQSPREYVTGESHYYNGRRYLLNVEYHVGRGTVSIRNNTTIDLFVQTGADRDQRELVYLRWCRKQLKDLVPLLLQKWQQILGVKPAGCGIKRMTTKWGSCNIGASYIWLNLELVKKPANCLEYVLVHELVHLLERHHNEQFIAYMDKFMPHWRFQKAELNRYPLLDIGVTEGEDDH